jgi:hypothetical protein
MSEIDLIEENIKLKEKINELTFELERTEFELRDARRQLAKYQTPTEVEFKVAPLTGIVVTEKSTEIENTTQYWAHQDS